MAAKDNLDKIVAELQATPLEITEAEVAGMLNAAGLATVAGDSAAVAYFTGQINAEMLRASPAIYEAVRAELTGTASDATLAAARAIAQREAATLARGIATSEINKMGEIVAQALKEGIHPFETARRLEMVTALDSNRAKTLLKYIDALDARDPPLSKEQWERMYEKEYNKLLADRKRTIARTEQGIAQAEGARVDAIASGAQYKVWLTAGDRRVSDACQRNEADGWIPINEPFATGSQMPLEHPNCRCDVAYRTATPGEEEKARADARTEKTKAAKEKGEE